MKYPRYSCRVLALLFIVLCLVPMLIAREGTTKLLQQSPSYIDDPLPLSQQARTIPFSNTTITLQISVDGGEPVKVGQSEGGMIRIEKLPRDGQPGLIIGFAPYISDPATETVSVRTMEITRIVKDGALIGEGIKELDNLLISKDFAEDFVVSPNSSSTFSLQLISVKRRTPEKRVSFKAGSIFQVEIEEGYGTCCVICNGIKYCGCIVETSCGSCCVGNCCN